MRIFSIFLFPLLLLSCGGSSSKAPSKSEVSNIVEAALPPYLEMKTISIDTIPATSEITKVNVKVVVATKEDLFLKERSVRGEPDFIELKQTHTKGNSAEFYGEIAAKWVVDKWEMVDTNLQKGLRQFGNPISEFGPNAALKESEKAKEFLILQEANEAAKKKAQAAKIATLEKEKAEIEAKKAAAEKALVDKKQAIADEHKSKLLVAVQPGTKYKGIIKLGSQFQNVELIFTEIDEFMIKAKFTGPDSSLDNRILNGTLDFSVRERGNYQKKYDILLNGEDLERKYKKQWYAFYSDVYFNIYLEGDMLIGSGNRGKLQLTREK